MARKEDLRFVRTNRKLYETFYELIAENLIEDLSITDICSAASINRATFYKHFNDRREFVFYCIGQKVREIRLERTGRENCNASYIHEDTMREICTFLRFMRSLNAGNLNPSSDTIRFVYDGLLAFYFREFSVYYAKNKKYLDVDADVIAAYRVGSLLSIAFYSLMKGPDAISEDSCEEIINTFVVRIKAVEM